MSQLHTAEIGPIERVVPKIEDRRQNPKRQRPFPSISEEEEESEDEQNQGPSEHEHSPKQAPTENTDGHQIDVVVSGRILPTRQILPVNLKERTLH